MITAALVSWPSAPLTHRLVLHALNNLGGKLDIIHVLSDKQYHRLIQWSTYDDIDHELTNIRRESVLASTYTFRKALIRKHYLAHSIHAYLTKNPSSILKNASPLTYDLDLAFADELDEKWADELYELSDFLDNEPEKWWILKPFVNIIDCPSVSSTHHRHDSGMADRGMGIRLFNTKNALQEIFQEFELSDSEDEGDAFGPGDRVSDASNTAVVTSQLRHFVIQVEMKFFWPISWFLLYVSWSRNTYCHHCSLTHAKYQFMMSLVLKTFISRDTKLALLLSPSCQYTSQDLEL